jgi:hypothetical protein
MALSPINANIKASFFGMLLDNVSTLQMSLPIVEGPGSLQDRIYHQHSNQSVSNATQLSDFKNIEPGPASPSCAMVFEPASPPQ